MSVMISLVLVTDLPSAKAQTFLEDLAAVAGRLPGAYIVEQSVQPAVETEIPLRELPLAQDRLNDLAQGGVHTLHQYWQMLVDEFGGRASIEDPELGHIGVNRWHPYPVVAFHVRRWLLHRGTVLARPIEYLDLPRRTKNALQAGRGLYIKPRYIVADLCESTARELLDLRNFGRSSLEEVERVLDAMGLHLATEIR